MVVLEIGALTKCNHLHRDPTSDSDTPKEGHCPLQRVWHRSPQHPGPGQPLQGLPATSAPPQRPRPTLPPAQGQPVCQEHPHPQVRPPHPAQPAPSRCSQVEAGPASSGSRTAASLCEQGPGGTEPTVASCACETASVTENRSLEMTLFPQGTLTARGPWRSKGKRAVREGHGPERAWPGSARVRSS